MAYLCMPGGYFRACMKRGREFFGEYTALTCRRTCGTRPQRRWKRPSRKLSLPHCCQEPQRRGFLAVYGKGALLQRIRQ